MSHIPRIPRRDPSAGTASPWAPPDAPHGGDGSDASQGDAAPSVPQGDGASDAPQGDAASGASRGDAGSNAQQGDAGSNAKQGDAAPAVLAPGTSGGVPADGPRSEPALHPASLPDDRRVAEPRDGQEMTGSRRGPERTDPQRAYQWPEDKRPEGRAAGRTASQREPLFMMPGVVVTLVVVLAGIQLIRAQLPPETDLYFVLAWFAFVPARYTDTFGMFPGGFGADVWTFVTYALLHGSWLHLASNAVWLVAFGSAVARRFGTLRFVVFFAVAAAAGAALHLALHQGEPTPVVGASAAIAGLMAAAARFVFDAGGPMAMSRSGDEAAFRRPARSLLKTLENRSAVFFIAIFFGINLLTGVGSTLSGGVAIAWEAHLGGFLAGLVMFRWFDPVPR